MGKAVLSVATASCEDALRQEKDIESSEGNLGFYIECQKIIM